MTREELPPAGPLFMESFRQKRPRANLALIGVIVPLVLLSPAAAQAIIYANRDGSLGVPYNSLGCCSP